MAIVKMNKFTLVFFRDKKNSVLRDIQKFGDSQFINLQDEENLKDSLDFLNSEKTEDDLKNIDISLSSIKSSISFLSKYVPKVSSLKLMKQGKEFVDYNDLQEFVSSYDWDFVCKELKLKEQRLSEINNEIAKLKVDINTLSHWESIDFPLKDLRNTKDVSIFTGVIKLVDKNKIDEFRHSFEELKLSYLSIVSEVNSGLYIVVLSHKDELKIVESILKTYDYADIKLSYEETPNDTILSLNEKVSNLENEYKEICSDLEKDENVYSLDKCEEYFLNLKERFVASRNLMVSDRTIVLSGWIPEESNLEFEAIAKDSTDNTYYLTYEDVEEKDESSVPIKLKNNKFVSLFESITEMYSLPGYKEIDPTPWLAPFYFLYFGMMVADIGYGLILTIAAFMAVKILKLDDSTEKFIKLFGWLGVSTTLWGLVFGAGFGDVIHFNSILSQSNDIFTIMYLSIGFGVFQILLALFIKLAMLLKAKQYFAAFSDVIIWLITFVGIALLVLKVPYGGYIMAGGMIGIVLTNTGDATSIGGKLGNGAYSLYNITGYMGDLISYTRLMALGISGGSIAGALNLIIGYIPGYAAIVIVPILFVLLHVFNLLLGLLGAYVHTCRLQYVEFFGKFYEGGGKPFKPFKMINKKINVK